MSKGHRATTTVGTKIFELCFPLLTIADYNCTMVPIGIKVLNQSSLAQFYDPLSLCLFQSYKDNSFAPNESYNHVLDHCKHQGFLGRNPHGFKILPSSAFTNKIRSVCCVEDLPLTDRGFDWVVDGYEDGTATPVLNMFLAMSRRNLSILLMGDSVNRQIYSAMMEELIREKGDVCGTLREFHIHGERWWYDGLHKKVLPSFPQSAAWTPNASCFSSVNHPLHTVYMYDVNMWYVILSLVYSTDNQHIDVVYFLEPISRLLYPQPTQPTLMLSFLLLITDC